MSETPESTEIEVAPIEGVDVQVDQEIVANAKVVAGTLAFIALVPATYIGVRAGIRKIKDNVAFYKAAKIVAESESETEVPEPIELEADVEA